MLAVATVVAVIGALIKYLLPGRRLKSAGVSGLALSVAGGVLGLVGFFVIPVIGLIIGFVLGVWLVERARLGSASGRGQSTKAALGAAGMAMLIEFTAGLGRRRGLDVRPARQLAVMSRGRPRPDRPGRGTSERVSRTRQADSAALEEQ